MKTFFLALIILPVIAMSQDFQFYLDEVEFSKRLNNSDRRINDSTTTSNFKAYRSVDDWGTEVLIQAKLITKSDGTKLLGIKGYEADMQCSFHHHKLYTINGENEIKPTTIEEQFNYNITDFYDTAIVHPIVKKHLRQIQKDYLDTTATYMQVIHEIYSPYVLFYEKNNSTQITLSLCDYILVNHGIFSESDWKKIADSVKTIQFEVK